MKNIVYCLFAFISLSIMSCHDNDIIQADAIGLLTNMGLLTIRWILLR